MRDVLLAQIEALQQQALLLAAQATGLLKTVEACWPVPAPEPEPPPAVPEEKDGQCLHPHTQRVSAATAGQPTRFACRRCGQWGGLKEKEGRDGQVS